MRSKSTGRFAPLSGTYFHDDAIDEVGLLAELLYVRSLAYCAQQLNDGFMTDRQVSRFVAIGFESHADLCRRLVDVGLWERDDERCGFQVRQWLKHNPSADEITRHRSKDAARKRGTSTSSKPPDGLRAESNGNPSTNIKQHNTTYGLRPSPTGTDGRSPMHVEPPDLTDVRETISRAATEARRKRSRDADA